MFAGDDTDDGVVVVDDVERAGEMVFVVFVSSTASVPLRSSADGRRLRTLTGMSPGAGWSRVELIAAGADDIDDRGLLLP